MEMIVIKISMQLLKAESVNKTQPFSAVVLRDPARFDVAKHEWRLFRCSWKWRAPVLVKETNQKPACCCTTFNSWVKTAHRLFPSTASLTKTPGVRKPSPRSLRCSVYLLVAADAAPDALQLGVADLPELVLGHGHHPLALGDELAAVADKEAVVTGERLQDLKWIETVVMQLQVSGFHLRYF